MRKKLYYIKERHNPQFEKPYYSGCGQLFKKQAKAMLGALYGTNYMLTYETEEEYNKALQDFKDKGFNVH